MVTGLGGLVDANKGLVSRRIFIEQDIYRQELERVFARCWLFLCHETQITQPGDFFSTYMGEDPVLVMRDTQGKVNAFLNVCRHRGNRVCRADTGNAASFTCAYHWVDLWKRWRAYRGAQPPGGLLRGAEAGGLGTGAGSPA